MEGLGWIPQFSPAARGAPGLKRVHSWCHLVALGHGKGRGSLVFIICVIIMGHYREIFLHDVSFVWAVSGPLPECETCRTKNAGSSTLLQSRMHRALRYVCLSDNQQVYGKSVKDSDEQDRWDVPCALQKELELVSVERRG